MKFILIILTILISPFVGKAQDYYPNGQPPVYKKFIPYQDKDGGMVIDTSPMYIKPKLNQCCVVQQGDNMFNNLPKPCNQKPYTELLYMPNRFQPYLSDDGTWIRTKAAAKKDTIVCLKSKTNFSKEDKAYIRNLVITAYYNGFNRNASVLNNEIRQFNKMKKDLKKLNTAIDKSFLTP